MHDPLVSQPDGGTVGFTVSPRHVAPPTLIATRPVERTMTDRANGSGVATDALVEYLDDVLDRTVTRAEVLADGLNLVVGIWSGGAEPSHVVRRPTLFRETASFNDLETEYRVLEELLDTSVPAPVPVHYCAEESILDGPFSVTTHLPGEAIPLGSDLPERFRTPAARGAVATATVDALADVHTVPVDRFADCLDRRTARDQIVSALQRLDRATSVTDREVPTLRSVADWLLANVPDDSPRTLVHGDFRPGNLLYDGTPAPTVTGILDWETAMVGDPLTDLGYLLLRWRDPGDPTPSIDVLESRYPDSAAIDDLRSRNEHGMAPFSARAGSPTRQELVDRYEERTGIAFEDDRFYRAHAVLMLGVVWEDLHRLRVEAGEPSDWPPHVDYVAMLAEQIVAGEFDL